MKKIIIIIAFLCGIVPNVISQDTVLTSKKGIPILPQKGDWAIGIDARPFANFFNSNSNVGFNFINDNTFFGKKFINNNTAYRARVRIGFNQFNNEFYSMEDGQIIPDPNVTVTDKQNINTMDITVGFGIEKRKGYGRLQGFYGAEVFVTVETQNENYTYGNDFSMTNPNPTSHNFGHNIPGAGGRYSYIEDGITFGGGIRGFLGVEYFFAPKISVGGEFGWGPGFGFTSEGKKKCKSWDIQNNSLKTETEKIAGSNGWGFDNGNLGGVVYFMFHF